MGATKGRIQSAANHNLRNFSLMSSRMSDYTCHMARSAINGLDHDEEEKIRIHLLLLFALLRRVIKYNSAASEEGIKFASLSPEKIPTKKCLVRCA